MRMRKMASVAALTAATIAPVIVAAPSHAVTVRTWNRLASCESSGRWHINTHNGYYGGLQISAPTWRAYGGRRFAALPNRASKAKQITVATRIKNHQGWRAWPTCSRRIGLR